MRRMFRRLVIGVTFVSVACSQPSTQPTPPPAGGPAAPTTGTSGSAALASAAATQPAIARSTPALASASPLASPSAAAKVEHFTISSAQSEARYIAREQLAANTIQSDAIGSTRDVNGDIIVDAAGHIASGSKVTVGLQSLTSDRSQRDNFIKRSTLQTDQFPTSEFTANDVQGLTTPLPASGPVTFTLRGDLTVHGTTQPVAWDVTSTLSEDDVTGKASSVVRLEQFGMSTPHVPIVASIEDDIRLELDFTAVRGT